MATENRKFAWWVERDGIAIVKRSIENTDTVYASPSEVKTITIFAVKRPNQLVAASSQSGKVGYAEEPDIPEEFRHAVVAKAIQRGYELNVETLAAAQYWKLNMKKA